MNVDLQLRQPYKIIGFDILSIAKHEIQFGSLQLQKLFVHTDISECGRGTMNSYLGSVLEKPECLVSRELGMCQVWKLSQNRQVNTKKWQGHPKFILNNSGLKSLKFQGQKNFPSPSALGMLQLGLKEVGGGSGECGIGEEAGFPGKVREQWQGASMMVPRHPC